MLALYLIVPGTDSSGTLAGCSMSKTQPADCNVPEK